jgi:hypothetical protein
MTIPEYCTQNGGDCATCSLVNYGRDCQNNTIKQGHNGQDGPRVLDDLWARYMGDVTTPLEYRAYVFAQNRIHELRQILEYDLELMYLATGEMSPDEIKQVAGEIYQALEAEKAHQAVLDIRAEKIVNRFPQVFRR